MDMTWSIHTNFQGRELRTLTYSLVLKQVKGVPSWKDNNTFVSFYLRDQFQIGYMTHSRCMVNTYQFLI